MINTTDREIAREFKEKLLANGVLVEELRVYGSRARGDFTVDSDLDICLILKEESPEIEALISRLAWEVGFEHQRIITTVEYTPDQWYHSPLRESPFIKAINQEGVFV
ncbi:MAG TPA: nucleotidyltransferase domain-containing protein [Bacillota bacterium]|nr:nucleotidyltransferase domain-containing protein [Bacillota bacterium]